MILVTNVAQEFSSPGYPNDYPNNANCQWILIPRNSRNLVRIEFVDFDTERKWDYVTVS